MTKKKERNLKMAKQFNFKKPVIRFDEDLLKKIGYKEIYKLKFFRKKIDKVSRHYRRNAKTGYYEDLEYTLRETKDMQRIITDEEWKLLKDFEINVDKIKHIIVGGVYCPFTDILLKEIPFGGIDIHRAITYYEDEEGEVQFKSYAYYDMIDPKRHRVDNVITDWYAKPVLDLMRDEWGYGNKNIIDTTKPDLTVVEDELTRAHVWYNKNGYTSLENLKVYQSTKGRFFKNRGRKNIYLESPEIENFEDKLKTYL